VKVLTDTHTLVWALSKPEELGTKARSLFSRGSSCAVLMNDHTAESGDVVGNPYDVSNANLQLVRCSRRRVLDL
jgi:hypothetical protein